MSSHSHYIKFITGAYIFCIFALVGSYFAVSSKQVQSAVFVRASPNWVIGKTNLLRAIYLNVPTGRRYNTGTATLTLASSTIKEAIPRHAYTQFEASPTPKDALANLEFFAGEENFKLDFPLSLQEQKRFELPDISPRNENSTQDYKTITKWTGDDTIQVIPSTGHVASGLNDEVFFLTRRKGVPTSMVIEIKAIEGSASPMKKIIRSNIYGIARIPVNAKTSIRLKIEIKNADQLSKGKVNIFTVPKQFSIKLERAYVPFGENIRGHVLSLRREGALFVDGYYRTRWASGRIYGLNKKGAGFELPTENSNAKPMDKLMRIQVYNSFFGAGTSWDSHWVAIGPPKRNDCEIFKDLAQTNFGEIAPQWPNEMVKLDAFSAKDSSPKEKHCRRLLTAFLKDLPEHFSKKTTIANTREPDLEALNLWKEKRKGYLKIVTGLFFSGGFIFIIFLVLKGFRERRALSLEIEKSTDDHDVKLQEDKLEHFLFYLRVVIILIALGSFIASLLMVMSFM